ncbi:MULTISPECIES: metallophosphoesterase [Basfia]|uniref:Calcineurin-like phosphoesterase domain-containing protein n=1 Tax=Basfia succiniciproducens TaxID=653940 RepID=A0A1G5CIS4_9PAST|nr:MULTISPECIES: metallophosphoesterase [Basfia]QIM68897.1 metallophosphoesterase [Basfia succiniciproducens]SCY02246.1 hypothetical protein SAMN02910354_01196 [Basfia succiniciproducens]
MELRHYIIFAVATLLLQLFLYIFNRTLFWLFSGKLTHRLRYFIGSFTFLTANGIIFLTIFRIQPLFRLSALILILLLFSAFISVGLALTYKLLKSFINSSILNRTLRAVYPIGMLILVGLSIYNAYTPKVIHYQIELDKPLKAMRIAVASDFHLGKLFGSEQIDKLARIIEREKADLVLLPGDIMDDNLNAYLAEQMSSHLAKLKAPLGVYATLGNHDFFGQQQAIADEINKTGIKVLWDEAVTINNEFVIVGRNDDLNKARPTTKRLLQNVDTNLPVFLMDHRPTEVTEHSALPIDVQVSGHTHNGQIFPANLIIKAMYRLGYGYEKIADGHFFVTSGYGFWGIPMRLGSQSEIFIIDVKGKN